MRAAPVRPVPPPLRRAGLHPPGGPAQPAPRSPAATPLRNSRRPTARFFPLAMFSYLDVVIPRASPSQSHALALKEVRPEGSAFSFPLSPESSEATMFRPRMQSHRGALGYETAKPRMPG